MNETSSVLLLRWLVSTWHLFLPCGVWIITSFAVEAAINGSVCDDQSCNIPHSTTWLCVMLSLCRQAGLN